jgi:hypothetical protein
MKFWCLQISQKVNLAFCPISALASKIGQMKKEWHIIMLISDYLSSIFFFDSFIEAMAEILQKQG